PPPPPCLYTLSLHDALPISYSATPPACPNCRFASSPSTSSSTAPSPTTRPTRSSPPTSSTCSAPSSSTAPTSASPSTATPTGARSEEHTSELQSRENLVCRL